MDKITTQAKYYNNIPILSPKYRSVVHLEDEEDKEFWNRILQKYKPGEYFYVSYSKSDKGNDTRGCDQCLKYRPYLNSRFFICIDSDIRHLMGESNLDADHYVIQTYTYSWENHYCEAEALQRAVSAHTGECGFDFRIFLNNLSKALYEPLLLLLYSKKSDIVFLTEYQFRLILKTQCTALEAQNNGQGYVDYITEQFEPLLTSASAIGFNAKKEAKLYSAQGLEADNAYLHVRGHNIYDLVVYIGKLYGKKQMMHFEKDVLKKVSLDGNYWELTAIEKDLRSI